MKPQPGEKIGMSGHTEDREQTLISHLKELRGCLLRAIVAVLIIFCGLIYFSNEIYRLIALPLIDNLPEGSSMIATEVASPFLTPLKLTFFLSVYIAVPYILYQAWLFISPGLYRNERRIAFPIISTGVLLFYAGTAFAYYIVFPLVFGFLTAISPEGVLIMTDIQHYLDFIIKLFFAFGLAFEIPIATFLLVRGGFVSVRNLRQKRPWIIIMAFVLGMLLTPPDILSQILLAVPVWLLFELGLIISAWYVKDDIEQETDGQS